MTSEDHEADVLSLLISNIEDNEPLDVWTAILEAHQAIPDEVGPVLMEFGAVIHDAVHDGRLAAEKLKSLIALGVSPFHSELQDTLYFYADQPDHCIIKAIAAAMVKDSETELVVYEKFDSLGWMTAKDEGHRKVVAIIQRAFAEKERDALEASLPNVSRPPRGKKPI